MASKNMSILNKNANAKIDYDDAHKKGGQIGQLLPAESEFKKAIIRRKSR